MNKVLLILGVITCIFADEGSIEYEREECEKQAMSTAETIECIKSEEKTWDSLMNRDYKRIMAKLTPEEQKEFRSLQRQWLAYRDAYFTLSEKLELKHNGVKLGSILYHRDRKDMVKNQSEMLMSVAATVDQ